MLEENISINWPIIGHRKIIKYLTKSIKSDSVAQSYLFYGPGNVGKNTVAHSFIKGLLCNDKTSRPCNNCLNCKKIENRNHPDISYLERSNESKNISIDEIRENVIHKHFLSSFSGSYKISIISGAENLSIGAANSLLKTLEEPKTKSIIILIANNADNLPKTIKSRCQMIEFNLVAQDDIKDFIKKTEPEIDHARLTNITYLSEGRPGLAWHYLHIPEFLKEREDCSNSLIKMLNSDINNRFSEITIITDGGSFQEGLNNTVKHIDNWLSVLRDVLLIKFNLKKHTINYFAHDKISNYSTAYSTKKIISMINKLVIIKDKTRQNINPRLMLENFFIDI